MVVSVLVLLAAMLVPSVSSALEQSRITLCSNLLHHIGIAMEQYTAENNNHFPFWGNNRDDSWRGLIGRYMGLDYVSSNWYWGLYTKNNTWIPWDQVKPFQCPSAAGLGKNASADGQMAVETCWLINSYYLGGAGPVNGYYPALQTYGASDNWPNYFCGGGPSRCGLLCEEWQANQNGITTANPDTSDLTQTTYQVAYANLAQPYSTHYKFGNLGAMGIGRNFLYADWHIEFRKCTFAGPWDGTADAGYWSDPTATAQWIPSTRQDRGNEVGYSFILGGKTFWGWRPIICHTDAYHFTVADWLWPW